MYKPSGDISRAEAWLMLNNVRMKKNDDPSVLFEKIYKIQNRYNTASRKLDDEDLIATVIVAAPMEYQSLLIAEQRRLGDKLTLNDLEEAMRLYYRYTTIREKV